MPGDGGARSSEKHILEMAGLSLGVAGLRFVVGLLARSVLGMKI